MAGLNLIQYFEYLSETVNHQDIEWIKLSKYFQKSKSPVDRQITGNFRDSRS